eukprot:2945527-Pyramimonas_sp.AAC.1
MAVCPPVSHTGSVRTGFLCPVRCQGSTDIDKAVTLAKVGDWIDRDEKRMIWSVVFNQEWTSYEVTFDNASMPVWIHTDEILALIPDHRPPPPDRAEEFL